jgi:3-hydroxyisobutyrate dehydrogenase-like beta-hydroxyacid dehydrogenase
MNAGNNTAVGWIGLGDMGLPMAIDIAEAGYPLHVWARHEASYQGLGGAAHIRHDTPAELAAACDIVGLCVATDEDVIKIVSEELLAALRPGSVVVNHGTGTPANARRLTELCASAKVEVLDAPVTGGRPAAQARALTALVGGPESVMRRCEPVFDAFSQHVVYLGGTGSGQLAKLFNNALLMMNQASIAEIVELAVKAGTDPVRLVDALKLGSATSVALTLLNTMITPETVDHLSTVEAEDMHIFDVAMTEEGVNAEEATARGLLGANRLTALIGRLNP